MDSYNTALTQAASEIFGKEVACSPPCLSNKVMFTGYLVMTINLDFESLCNNSSISDAILRSV